MAMLQNLPGVLSGCSVEDVVAGTFGTASRDTWGEVILSEEDLWETENVY